MRYYLAIIEKGDAEFGVFFPDVPGCIGSGATLAEAIEDGRWALAAHLDLLLEDGDPFPEPSGRVDFPVDSEVHEVARVLVPYEGDGKPVRVNIHLPHNLLLKVDRYAADRGFTRSGFLALAARDMMQRQTDS